MKLARHLVLAAIGLMAPISAQASNLNYTLTADNAFALFMSPTNNTLGTFVFSNLGPMATAGQWSTPFSGTAALSGSVEYVHIIGFNYTLQNGLWTSPGTARDGDNPDALIGSLSISSGYHFAANGGISLVTNATPGQWSAIMVPPPNPDIPSAGADFSNPLWMTPNSTPADYGVNGVGPWGLDGAIDLTAHWIWSIPDNGEYADFSTAIVKNGESLPTPLPGALPLFAGGLALIGMFGVRKRRKAQATAA